MAAPHTVRAGHARTAITYVGLVVFPAVAAVVLLTTGDGGHGPQPGTLAALGHPLARLLLAATVIIVACHAAGMLARRIGQPPVVGEIAAGIILGPTALGSAWPAAAQWLVPTTTVSQLQVLAQVGVVLFVFLAGLELNVARLRGSGPLAIVVSHVSIATPFLLGVGLAVVAHSRFAPTGVGYVPFALFLGVALSVTALPVLARILFDLDMYHSKIGALVMTCALVDDVTAWLLLALVVAVASASSLLAVLATLLLTAAFAGLLWMLRPRLAQLLGASGTPAHRHAVHVILPCVLLAAACTEWIGVHAIFGAFLFGLALPGDTEAAVRIKNMISGLTSTLLLPLFFAISGLGTDLRLLVTDSGLWLWAAAILAVATLGKLGGSTLGARAMGTTPSTAWQIGALMNCRGLTELVVLDVGRQLGLLTPALFAILVLMTLVTTALAAPLVTMFQRANPATGHF